ncbi:hypothetical protein RUM44_009202 [Polyplax serrata]|uniref:Uncharacterized protein n=1 Tax=Polyplax serrata TaxID=468196 RepID=A0ABR1AS20_POLSC
MKGNKKSQRNEGKSNRSEKRSNMAAMTMSQPHHQVCSFGLGGKKTLEAKPPQNDCARVVVGSEIGILTSVERGKLRIVQGRACSRGNRKRSVQKRQSKTDSGSVNEIRFRLTSLTRPDTSGYPCDNDRIPTQWKFDWRNETCEWVAGREALATQTNNQNYQLPVFKTTMSANFS